MDSNPADLSSAHNPHDRFFRETFGRTDVAASFFEDFLPSEIAASIDWSTLTRIPASFIDETLNERASDLLFEVKWKKTGLFLHCLFEHQSQPDPLMSLRLLRYMVRIWDEHLKKNPSALPLPLIIPVVLHHNRKNWNTHMKLSELFQLSDDKQGAFSGYIPDFSFELIDLAPTFFEKLRSGTIGKTMLCVLKIIHEGEPLERLKELLPLLAGALNDHHDPSFLRIVLTYLIRTSERIDTPDFRHTLLSTNFQKIRQTTMTLYDQLIEEGRQEGRIEGEAAVLERLLARRFGTLPQTVVGRLRSASQSQLEELSDRIFEARSLEEVFIDHPVSQF